MTNWIGSDPRRLFGINARAAGRGGGKSSARLTIGVRYRQDADRGISHQVEKRSRNRPKELGLVGSRPTPGCTPEIPQKVASEFDFC